MLFAKSRSTINMLRTGLDEAFEIVVGEGGSAFWRPLHLYCMLLLV